MADASTIGQVPSFAMPGSIFGVRPTAPTIAGSPYGMPPTAGIAGQTADIGGGVNAAINDAAETAQRSAVNQPIFWAIVMVVVGVAMLAHVAHVSIR